MRPFPQRERVTYLALFLSGLIAAMIFLPAMLGLAGLMSVDTVAGLSTILAIVLGGPLIATMLALVVASVWGAIAGPGVLRSRLLVWWVVVGGCVAAVTNLSLAFWSLGVVLSLSLPVLWYHRAENKSFALLATIKALIG